MVTRKVFQQSSNGYKKVVSMVKKEVFFKCFYGEKKLFQRSFHSGVSTVKIKKKMSRNGYKSQRYNLVRCLHGVSTVKKALFRR